MYIGWYVRVALAVNVFTHPVTYCTGETERHFIVMADCEVGTALDLAIRHTEGTISHTGLTRLFGPHDVTHLQDRLATEGVLFTILRLEEQPHHA